MYSLISLIYNKYYLNILTYIVFYTKTFRVTKILSLLIIFFLELFGVQNYTVWLWHSLTIFLGDCSDFQLSWSTELTYIRPPAPTAIGNNVNFTIQNVTREYDNVTMTVQAEIGRRCVIQELHTWYPWWVYVSFVWCDCSLNECLFLGTFHLLFSTRMCSRAKHLVLSVCV